MILRMWKRREQGAAGAGGIQADQAPAGTQHAALFAQGLVKIDHVAHEKAGNQRIEAGGGEGQVERIRAGPIPRGGIAGFANQHHVEGEIAGGNLAGRLLVERLAGQVAGAGAQVEEMV